MQTQPGGRLPGTNYPNTMTAKAQWIADLMRADGVKPEQVTPELVLAYMDAIAKKIEAIQNTYITRSGAREAMTAAIRAKL